MSESSFQTARVIGSGTILDTARFRHLLSLPSVVGREGIERVIRLEMSPPEADALRRSADVLRATIGQLGLASA